MDGLVYYGSLLLIIALSYMFFQNNSSFLMLITIGIGIYIVYSHETGYTATAFKDEVVHSINEEAGDFTNEKGIHGYDAKKLEREVH
jgi:Ca2+-dependent lipid-binding protein